jgi:hypothetical protein
MGFKSENGAMEKGDSEGLAVGEVNVLGGLQV